MNYNMNNLDKTLIKLHGIRKTVEASMKKPTISNPTTLVLAIDRGSSKRKKNLILKERERLWLDTLTKALRERSRPR